MFKLLRYLIPCLFTLLSLVASAQDNSKTLLWRITGHGLQQPSYLFGTMHMSDKRLFRFDDSVYAAIEKSEGLAIEVNMNDLAAYYINKLFDETPDDKKLNEVLSDKDLAEMEKPLTRKFRKRLRDITIKDIVREKNKWLSGYFSKGEMPTFLDAYLFDIANRQGKWVGGIEDIEDQVNALDRTDIKMMLSGEEDLTLEQLIKLYTAQDIEGIGQRINSYGAQYKDEILIKRNVKMARRMDSMSAARTMFFAVGAAHLAGDSGLIFLLRERGFTVVPVFSDKKIAASDYKCPTEVTRWQEVKSKTDLYTIDMTGNPGSIMIYGIVEMKFLLDFSNLSGYCVMATVNPPDGQSDDSFFNAAARTVYQKKNVREPLRVVNGGVVGAEYVDKKGEHTIRMQVFRTGNVNYLAWVFSKDPLYVESEKVEHFFNSYKLTPQVATGKKDYKFIDSSIAISFRAPAEIEYNDKLTKQNGVVEGWDIRFFSGQDQQSGAYIMLLSKQAKASDYVANDSVILDELYQVYKEKNKASMEWTDLNGYRAIKMKGTAESYDMDMLAYVRGNKNIVLIIISQQGKGDTLVQQIYKSIQLLPYKHEQWREHMDSTLACKVVIPDDLRFVEQEKKYIKTIQWYSFDSMSTTTYYISVDTMNKYEWSVNDSAYFRWKADDYKGKNDSIVSYTITKNGTIPAGDFLMRKNHSNSYQRMRFVPYGNIMYTLNAGGDRQALMSADAARFFEGFLPMYKAGTEFHEHRGRQLITALQSNDSATRAVAYRALQDVYWEKKDLDLLYEGFLYDYPESGDWNGGKYINMQVGRQIGKLADASTVEFMCRQFRNRKGLSVDIKENILSVLANIHTPQSYDSLAVLLQLRQPGEVYEYNFRYAMRKDLKLLKSIFPTLLQLLPDTTSGLFAAHLIHHLNDSGLLSHAELLMVAPGVQKLSAQTIERTRQRRGTYWELFDLLAMLDVVDTKVATQELKGYLTAGSNYIRQKAALYLLDKGVEVPPAVWDSIASDPAMRIGIYETLKEKVKVNLFPSRFLKQKYFAEATVLGLASDDDYEIASFEYIGERKANVKGSKLRFYLYKITLEEDSNAYMGVAGGYALTGEQLFTQEYASGIYWREPYTDQDAGKLLAAYLAQKEEYDSAE